MPKSINKVAPADSALVLREIAQGQGQGLAQIAKLLPGSRGRPCSPSTLLRWAAEGVLVDGRRVFLEVGRLGSRWLTTKGAIERFLAAQNCIAAPASDEVRPIDERREREIAEAENKLRDAGL